MGKIDFAKASSLTPRPPRGNLLPAEGITPSAATPYDGISFFRGVLIALPLGIAGWVGVYFLLRWLLVDRHSDRKTAQSGGR